MKSPNAAVGTRTDEAKRTSKRSHRWFLGPEALSFLACPACQGSLEPSFPLSAAGFAEGELKCRGCSRPWPVRDGVPELVYPDELNAQDLQSRRLWNRIASFYDRIGALTNVMRGIAGTRERSNLVQRLELQPGQCVLEVAAGSGGNIRVIADQMSDRVTVFGLDLSTRMLGRAIRNLREVRPRPTLVLGNSNRLPFADDAFDAVLDGFGMKYYSDKGGAVREMLRVVKAGGKVVITELGLPPDKRRNFRQRLLLLWIPHFGQGPPLGEIPGDVIDRKVEWDRHETAYVVEFRKPTRPQQIQGILPSEALLGEGGVQWSR